MSGAPFMTSLRIGSFTQMTIDIDHIRVRAEDADIFRGVVCAREALEEKQITRFVPTDPRALCLSGETLNLALDARNQLAAQHIDAAGRRRAIRLLQLTAAMAITALEALQKES
ncbi:MAG: hypothetical protein ABS48_01635 [Erythrobacter sp. SCN 68-10]|nr:MAG: hypothetical protein ABS48_01635 [Erythrobacter sp. SCN 68-10]